MVLYNEKYPNFRKLIKTLINVDINDCYWQIRKLTRWEVIDVVRTMSTEQAKAGQQEGEGKTRDFCQLVKIHMTACAVIFQ